MAVVITKDTHSVKRQEGGDFLVQITLNIDDDAAPSVFRPVKITLVDTFVPSVDTVQALTDRMLAQAQTKADAKKQEIQDFIDAANREAASKSAANTVITNIIAGLQW